MLLIGNEREDHDEVVIINAETLQTVRSIALDRGVYTYRSIATTKDSPNAYLFGNDKSIVIMLTLELDSARLVASTVLKSDLQHDWSVYQGVISEDEREVYVSYHGVDTTGIDRFVIAPQKGGDCPTVPLPDRGLHLRPWWISALTREAVRRYGHPGHSRA